MLAWELIQVKKIRQSVWGVSSWFSKGEFDATVRNNTMTLKAMCWNHKVEMLDIQVKTIDPSDSLWTEVMNGPFAMGCMKVGGFTKFVFGKFKRFGLDLLLVSCFPMVYCFYHCWYWNCFSLLVFLSSFFI